MSIRTDRDGTWDAEGDNGGDDTLFHDRLDETSYSAATWIMEAFRRPDAEDEAAEDDEPAEPIEPVFPGSEQP
jgi:hypothetical protein